MKALPDSKTSFAHTQALWRFLHNDSVTPSALAQPLLTGAQEAIHACCQHYTLVAHDWSRLNYHRHTSKSDRHQMTHATDVGYELQSSLLIGDQHGEPLAPVAHNLRTGPCTLSTYRPAYKTPLAHLDELSERMNWLSQQPALTQTQKPLVHLVDREADSVRHLRDWSAQGHLWLIRAKAGSRVQTGGRDTRLDTLAQTLNYEVVREVSYQGKVGTQWVAQTAVVLTRQAKPRSASREAAAGPRSTPAAPPAPPLAVRLIVSRIQDAQGQVVACWYLLSNVPAEVDAATAALWYYFRWRIESFFKLLKQAGHQIECWEQETGEAIFKRLLIACQACVLTWRLLREQGVLADQVKQFLVRLSGRQTKRSAPITAPALLSGLYTFFALLDVLENHSVEELRSFARFVQPSQKFSS